MDNWEKRITCAEAREMDIVNFLAELGIQPAKIRGVNFWYFSPFRNEKTPSFKVNRKLNRWYDFGEGCGGNLIDFAIRYNNCTVGEFLNILSGNNFPLHKPEFQNSQFDEAEPGIIFIKERPLFSFPLISYLHKRAIPLTIADRFCKEVTYTFKSKNKEYYAIGFKNDTNGWELRNGFFKGSIAPKDSTSFQRDNNILCVFEGFMDFLSFMTIMPEAKYQYDFIILNGIWLFEGKRDFIEAYQEVWLFFDRDSTGLKRTLYACSLSTVYKDKSELYKNHKDLNEYLTMR